MGWRDTVLEYAEKGAKVVHGGHIAAEVVHYAETGVKAVKDAKTSLEFFKDLSTAEKAREVYAAGKEAFAEAKEGPAGKMLDKAGKVIAIGETLIDYGKGVNELAKGNVDAFGKHVSTGVVNLGIAGTGPAGMIADKVGTPLLQAYAKHELGRPLTDQEQKDINFKNMAADGLNATLKKGGDVIEKGMEKAVPPEITYQAMQDVDKAMSKPGFLDKAKGLAHAGHDFVKNVANAHGI
jgi:hypothetical protein